MKRQSCDTNKTRNTDSKSETRFAEFGRNAELITALYEFLSVPFGSDAEKIICEFQTWATQKRIDPEASVLWLAEWLSENYSKPISAVISRRSTKQLQTNHPELLKIFDEMLLWDTITRDRRFSLYVHPLITLDALRRIAPARIRDGIGTEIIVEQLYEEEPETKSLEYTHTIEYLKLTGKEKAQIINTLAKRLEPDRRDDVLYNACAQIDVFSDMPSFYKYANDTTRNIIQRYHQEVLATVNNDMVKKFFEHFFSGKVGLRWHVEYGQLDGRYCIAFVDRQNPVNKQTQRLSKFSFMYVLWEGIIGKYYYRLGYTRVPYQEATR